MFIVLTNIFLAVPRAMSVNETGAVTIFTGSLVLISGVFFLSDKALVISGNLLIICGFVIVLRSGTFSVFKLEKLHGTAFFALGISMLLMKYAFLGVLLEVIGLLMIFKASLPSVNSLFYSVLLRKPIVSKK